MDSASARDAECFGRTFASSKRAGGEGLVFSLGVGFAAVVGCRWWNGFTVYDFNVHRFVRFMGALCHKDLYPIDGVRSSVGALYASNGQGACVIDARIPKVMLVISEKLLDCKHCKVKLLLHSLNHVGTPRTASVKRIYAVDDGEFAS